MLRLFHIIAFVPYMITSALGLNSKFVNVVDCYKGYRNRATARYIAISSRKPFRFLEWWSWIFSKPASVNIFSSTPISKLSKTGIAAYSLIKRHDFHAAVSRLKSAWSYSYKASEPPGRRSRKNSAATSLGSVEWIRVSMVKMPSKFTFSKQSKLW